MDSEQPGASSTFSWSTRLLTAIGVRPSDLSAAIWMRLTEAPGSEPILIPAEPHHGGTADAPTVLEVAPGTDFDTIRYSISDVDGRRQYLERMPAGETFYGKNTIIPLHIPTTVPRGVLLRVTIYGAYEGGTDTEEVVIWIPS